MTLIEILLYNYFGGKNGDITAKFEFYMVTICKKNYRKNQTIIKWKFMKNLIKRYDELQKVFGSKDLYSVYGCGENCNPRIALVFMNPTKKNITTDKSWQGLKAPWLGTKQIWDFLEKCGLFNAAINEEIKSKKPKDWTPAFCEYVYNEVKNQGLWITNLAKCTQEDARPLPDSVFLQYKDLLKEELKLVNPRKIFFFGNQVSSIMLEKQISVSTTRQQKFTLKIGDKKFESYALFYPVGNGRFNQDKTIEDIKGILNE